MWRGSQTEAKYSRALNLLLISREVSKFLFLFNIFWPKLLPGSCKGTRFAPLRFSILFLIFWFRLSMYMLSAYVSLPTFIHCADCSYFLNIKYITTCVIPYCGIPISSPYTIKFGQKQTQIHYEKLPHPPHGGDFLCRYQCLDRRGGGGGSGYGNRCSIWCFFLFCNYFFGQIPDPWDWKIVQIWWNIPFFGIAKPQLEAKFVVKIFKYGTKKVLKSRTYARTPISPPKHWYSHYGYV